MVPVTLTASEFEKLHNALCSLAYVDNELVKQKLEEIRSALRGAYKQESEIMDRRYDHYSEVKKALGLDAVWSITDVEYMGANHTFKDAKFVSYRSFWSDTTVTLSIEGTTWADLYEVADACIKESGDEHHCFIESFEPKGNILHLVTGS